MSRAGYYLHLSLGRLSRMSDHYVSFIFPTSKSTQPSHALPARPCPTTPRSFYCSCLHQCPNQTAALHYSVFPPKYFGICSYLQGTHGTCRTALPTIVHSFHPCDFFCSFSKGNLVTDLVLNLFSVVRQSNLRSDTSA